jgi:hypothetical protein
VEGREHVVKVISGGAELEKNESGKLLLRIRITAEVDSVRREYTIIFSKRGGDNAAVGYAYVSAKVPGSREADAERLVAVIEAPTGKRPGVYRKKNGQIMIEAAESI